MGRLGYVSIVTIPQAAKGICTDAEPAVNRQYPES